MSLRIQKYGGSSIATPQKIIELSERLARWYQNGDEIVVVVSAMGRTTDDLQALARQIAPEPPNREMDMLLSVGERVSMALLSMALSERGVPAISLTGSQCGIVTTRSHRRAKILKVLGDRIRAGLTEGKIVIVAGFQGVSEDKEITTLGRGGSDTSAVALAITLKTDVCEIYTDVDGVCSADPNQVSDEVLCQKSIAYDQMIEMSSAGAGVLHPRSVKLAHRYGVRLEVGRTSEEDDSQRIKTRIGPEEKVETAKIISVTVDKEQFLMSIELSRPTVSSAVTDFAKKESLKVFCPAVDDCKLSFFAERDHLEVWKQGLDRLAVDGFLRSFEANEEWTPITVVSTGFAEDGSDLGAIIECFQKNELRWRLGNASETRVTFAVRLVDAKEAIQALHQRFFGDKTDT